MLLLAGVAHAGETGMKLDREVDFSKYKTFGWVLDTEKPADSPLAPGGEIDTMVRNAIDAQLRAQGFKPAMDGEADFVVSFDGVLEPELEITSVRRQIAEGVAWVVDGSISSFYRGTLVISISDGETGNPVWSGWTTDKIKKQGEIDQQKVSKAVKKILRRFMTLRLSSER